ncbi:MAG: hypothetical protein K2Z81_12225, partial [Cyanobacteria bacterium]|nr:hypothetical protein [Cyanobacteriota bacterium]
TLEGELVLLNDLQRVMTIDPSAASRVLYTYLSAEIESSSGKIRGQTGQRINRGPSVEAVTGKVGAYAIVGAFVLSELAKKR